MCDEKWNVGKSFNSLREANRYIEDNIWSKTIKQKIDNKEKYHGYYWKYADEYEIN